MSEWRKFVKDQYNKLKKTNPHVSLGEAMKKASQEWKKRGQNGMGNTEKRRKSQRKSRRNRRTRRR